MARARERVIGLKDLTGYFRGLAREAPGKVTARLCREGAGVVLEAAKQNIRNTFENQTGNLENSGEVVVVNQYTADVRFNAIYSAVHEYGLENQPITDRQRRFFWAKWYEEGNEMWVALALSTHYTIPARPYLRPAIDSHKQKAAHEMAGALRHEMTKRRSAYKLGGRLTL